MKRRPVLISLTVFFITLFAAMFVYDQIKSRSRNTLGQVLFWAKDQTDDRVLLTLSWPLDLTSTKEFMAYLMNRDGTIFHSWKLDRNPMHARLLPNGNLLVIFMSESNDRQRGLGSECDEIAEFDWDGKKLWSHSIPMIHHDIFPIDENRIATLQSEALPTDAKARFVPDVAGVAFSDSIVVFDKRTKETTWSWSFTDALFDLRDRIFDPSSFNIAHINSVQYVRSTPWSDKPAFIVSVRQISTILVIEEESKKILWTSPKGLTHFQHDAQLLDDGKILVFDNGLRGSVAESRVLLINPQTNQIDWKWADDQKMWASQLMGGAQKLPNGNVVITNSMIGQIFEVNHAGQIVWNFIGKFDLGNPANQHSWWPGMRMYRVRAYPRPSPTS